MPINFLEMEGFKPKPAASVPPAAPPPVPAAPEKAPDDKLVSTPEEEPDVQDASEPESDAPESGFIEPEVTGHDSEEKAAVEAVEKVSEEMPEQEPVLPQEKAEKPIAKDRRQPLPPAGVARGKGTVFPRRGIRDLPGSLVEMAVRASGNASISNIRAVEAFLFANRDKRLDDEISYADISDEVAGLAKEFDTARERREFDRRISAMERRIAAIDSTLDRVLWAMIYLVWHSTGMRTDSPVSPDEIKFDQDFDGFEATLKVLSDAVSKYSKDRQRREGRPIR